MTILEFWHTPKTIFYVIILIFRYWIREGDFKYPSSCQDIMNRGFKKNGVYKIRQDSKIKTTYCDFERYGGGWTLVTNVVSKTGWTVDNAKVRDSEDPLNNDYSIFGMIKKLSNSHEVEVRFHCCLKGLKVYFMNLSVVVDQNHSINEIILRQTHHKAETL